jgi:hypothetical protein
MPAGTPIRAEPKPKKRICIDCPPPLKPYQARPAPHPGPRCTTHDRARTAHVRQARKANYQQRTFNLAETKRQAILAAQGGLCAICGPWTGYNGRTRALSTDHDHSCCPGPTSCGRCIRGLICKHCNDLLGRLRDDPRALLRAVLYLLRPPADNIDSWASLAVQWMEHPPIPELP